MKNLIIISSLLLFCTNALAQYSEKNRPSLRFNEPYVSNNNRSIILAADRIPSDFLGCTLGVTTEVDALKNLNRLGIPYSSSKTGVSEILSISGEKNGGDIECEGVKFGGVDLWFYNNRFWKIVFIIMRSDSQVLERIIQQKYSRFPKVKEKSGYIRYIGSNTDLVHNDYNLQYTIRGGSATRLED